MEAKELMIGDWVNVSARFLETTEERNATSGSYKLRQENCRVSGLNGDLIAIDKIYSDVFSYEPIPLTEEVLKVNADGGSCRFDDFRSIYHLKNNGYHNVVAIIFDKTWYEPFVELTGMGNTVVKTNISYVHQLQHALRLCGLTELADNFKIE